MPENYTVAVKAAKLVKGDILVNGRVVESVDAKVKWTTINFKTDAPLGQAHRVENDTEFEVTRTRATAEEDEATRIKAMLVWIDMQERSARSALKQARAKLAAESSSGDLHVESRYMHDVLEAQARNAIWGLVAVISMNRWIRGEEEGKIEILISIREKITQELLEYQRYSSRSTSTWSNAVEDVSLDAKSRFLRDVKWNLAILG